MNKFFPLKQVKIIVGICVIIAVVAIIIFNKKSAETIERATYCDGYALQKKELDPTIDFKTEYANCINTYAQS